MNRRELLSQGVVVASAVAASSALAGKNIAMAASGKSLTELALHCVATGEACLTHCLDLLAKGDKSVAECSKTVRDMLASCHALATLSASNSKHLKELAKVCAKVCQDCSEACKKHANHHETCKACMESCDACAKACLAA